MARSSSRPSRLYRSKIDAWMGVILGFAVVAMVSAPVAAWLKTGNPRSLLVGLVVVPGVALVIWIVLNTHYTLEGRELIVRSGPFRWHIDVADIKSITPVRGIGMRIRSSRSSPALSMDRLEIVYGSDKRLMISPADQDAFLKDIATRRSGK
jgi:Bacterial PH domain